MKRILFFTICIIMLMVILNISKSIYELYHKKDLLTATANKLARVKKENKELKDQLTLVQNPDFVEQQARDKLFLARPGESSVLLPTPTPLAQSQEAQDSRPYWQQWWDLFFAN